MGSPGPKGAPGVRGLDGLPGPKGDSGFSGQTLPYPGAIDLTSKFFDSN